MHEFYGCYSKAFKPECLVVYLMFLYPWSSGILVFGGKNIIEAFPKRIKHPFFPVNRDVTLSEKKWPYIVQAGGMVIVLVRVKNGIQALDIVRQHLLPEIWSAINKDIIFFPGDQNRNPQPFIFRIFT